MRDIAAKAGVSRVTVSLALRNDYRISLERRKDIQDMAREMGFVPDPFLSALAAHQRQQRPTASHGVLAWINHWRNPEQLRQFKEFDLYWRGAYEAADRYGYRLDDIHWPVECSPKRLERILVARGIKGVLIPPHRELIDWGDFDWNKFSVVRFGMSVPTPDSNVVTADIFRAMAMAVGKIHERGYRRIGLIVNQRFNQRTGGNLLSGFFYAQKLLALSAVLPPLQTFLENRTADELSRQKLALDAWLKQHKPDALLISDIEVPRMLRDLGYRIPQDIAVVGTTVFDIPGVDAGIDQHAEAIGKAAVETLMKQMKVNERGVPRHPSRILIESRWKDGNSLPCLDASMFKGSVLSAVQETLPSEAVVRRVTLKDIADKAGVSKITVSLALRQSSRVSSQTLVKIRRVADELGYVADPILQRLSFYRRTDATGEFKSVIAWLNHWSEPKKLRSYHEFDQYWRGAKQAANRLGYQLEEFIWPADLQAKQAEQMLQERGVLGLLIPPHKPEVAWGNFAWNHFSLMRFGYSVQGVDANVVAADHLRAMIMAIKKMQGYGYKRIGLVYDAAHDCYMGGNIYGGFIGAINISGLHPLIPALDFNVQTFDQDSGLLAIKKWMLKYRPEAVITAAPQFPLLLQKLGYRIPSDVAVAATSLHDISLDAGIDQCPRAIGQIAAEMLIKQISLSERGEPAEPYRILVESRWRDGKSLPPRLA